VIVTSASLNRKQWEQVVQLGWVADFPVLVEPTSWVALTEQEEESSKSAFGRELSEFLSVLDVDADSFLTCVDFSALSPCVRLVTSKPGQFTFGIVQSKLYDTVYKRNL
jgi:hypothetical protein